MSVHDVQYVPAATSLLGEVSSVDDPDGLNRVEVRLLAFEGAEGQEGTLWARVAVPVAGNDYGAFFIPNVGDEVLINFVNGDPRQAVVVGSLWNGRNVAPDEIGGSKSEVDRWAMTAPGGTRIAIEEPSSGSAKITLKTKAGVKAVLNNSGTITLRASGSTITIDGSGVSVQTGGTAKVESSMMELTTSMLTVNAPVAQFSGVITCNVMQATTVLASTYTPGAGNVW